MILLSDMLNNNECHTFLHHQQNRIHAPNMKVTASMIMKRYAQIYPPYILNSMLWEDSCKVIPLSACHFSEQLNLEIDGTQVTYTDSRATAWKHLFCDHLTEVVTALHRTTNLASIILWENVAVRFNSYFRKTVEKHPELEDKIFYLVSELHRLEAKDFNQPSHPMSTYLTTPDTLTMTKKRSTCCYFHKLEKDKEMSHCLVCPVK
ncbi:hypothetical protein F0342_10930 [Bacillus sp. CH30_1T]|uniref:IucA/IucC family C-terminal-domain containing protein n=1 Tax=Bacillus sp. CH30_1T TaxID=2604836 RepID=UPI0011EC55A2|nr:IucA/IucC family C-terminal-domain containing protein [Bacillus sp. CH30_1T]KAA0564653.1 hypothetical protein F0342_10930 [Bacillus sp. CH30_1T]